jgi:peptidoglycan/xylan/chitin deacetylase (PgdA/CDA1 family)
MSQIYERGTSGRPEVALTFDAGADRGYTEEILDVLKEYGVKASFGITGHWAEANPDLIKRMVAEGHMIFNHTWSHRSFTGASTAGWDEGVLTREERQKELFDTAKLIRKLTKGYETAPYFRPPYGDLDDSVLADLADAGYYITVMWTCDSFGWNGATVDEILERCAEPAQAGDIILLHVGAESQDAAALPRMIEILQDKGFQLVTVEELLQP